MPPKKKENSKEKYLGDHTPINYLNKDIERLEFKKDKDFIKKENEFKQKSAILKSKANS